MVFGAPDGLTRVGFRRDVRLFLGVLVGFLVVLIVMLLLLLQSFLWNARSVVENHWSAVSRMVMDEIHQSDLLSDRASLEPRLDMLRSRYRIDGITIRDGPERERVLGLPATTEGVENIVRPAGPAIITFTFDASGLRNMNRIFWATAIISLVAAGAGALLLLAYLPRITRPIEEMLDTASQIEQRPPEHDEQQYLIDTFRRSIATLRSQEDELQRMHDLQKSRADDLERVTAALTRSLASGFLSVDAGGRIVQMNAAAREILVTAEDVTGALLESAFPESGFRAALRRAADERIALTRVEVAVEEPVSRVIGLTTVPLLGEERQFLGMLALFTDLTHIRQLESRVRDMQTLADLGEISAGIAHEFRNSLGAMLGFIRLARKDALAEKTMRFLENAEKEASELSAAVDSLLAFARPMRLATAPVDLAELVRSVVERIASVAPVEVDLEPVIVEADAALLSRAVENLIRNASDSVEQKGSGAVRIRVTSEPVPSIVIEDDGVGFDPAELPRLLLPFQSSKADGYGLGLPLARKIALLHGAQLEMEPREGQGVRAAIVFHEGRRPAAAPPASHSWYNS